METLGLIISCVLLISVLIYLAVFKNRNQLQQIFIIDCALGFAWCALLLAQKYFCMVTSINPIMFEWFIYIFSSAMPIAILFTGIIFANTKIAFKKRYYFLFVIPILSLIMLWTNDFHHLFYVNYSTEMNGTVYGSYFYLVHTSYTYILYIIGFTYLIRYSIKNSGIFSKQAILLLTATLLPALVNVLGIFHIVPMSIYLTPISFSFTIILAAFAILKFKMAKVSPIALQKIVDRISDSYVVLNEYDVITDFNQTFIDTFKLVSFDIRNVNIFDLLATAKTPLINNDVLKNALETVKHSSKTLSFDRQFESYKKYFHIEINTITSKGNFLGTLILFKDVTQHMEDLQTIKNNQNMLMERERLASLGQLIGGIAHNLKTPIMSISGAAEGLSDLVKEYEISVGNSNVTIQDHYDIAKDMKSWIEKIRSYTEYMSDVITAVKGQAVNMSEERTVSFSLDELVKRVNILMMHELKNALITLNVEMKTDSSLNLHGNINSLVQVINNMISNSIQAYNGVPNNVINFILEKSGDNIIISVQDFATGLSDEVQAKLFKEMITTKGKNGSGLGLFMSYSTIRAHFNGNISFDTKKGAGTTFHIALPVQ